jgi:PAS domain S-box-containing protein
MTGENDPGFGKTTAAQMLRKRAEEKVAADNKPFTDMSTSEMSTLIHELRIHLVGLEMQNEELRKSQAETEGSRKAYQDLWELSPVGYLIVDFIGRVTAVNRAAQRLFGRPENALLKEYFSTLVTPENQVPVHLMFERAVETGIVEKQEIRILKPGGAIHICLLEVCSLGGQPGREQIQAVLTDITQQKRAEDDLKKKEQEKIAILDSLVEHVVYQDREMKILWANRAACESVQMKREDLLGRNCHEVWADRRSPCEDCSVIKARETGQPQRVEKMTTDGRWWYIQGHPVRDHNGHDMGTTEITLDITDRKRAEEELRNAKDKLELRVEQRTAELVGMNEKLRQEIEERKRSEKELHETKNLLSNTFNAIQDMVTVIDTDFRVRMSNWKGHDYISEKDRQGYPYCYEVFMNRKKTCNPCYAMEVFSAGEINQLEATNPIDGKIRDIRVFPMLDDKGKVVAVIEHLRDITELKQSEEALRESEEKYRQLFENESDAVMIFDAETLRFEDANRATLNLYGYSKEEFLTLTVVDVSAEKEKTRVAVKKVKSGELGGNLVPLRYFKRKDGSVFPGEINAGNFISKGRKKIIGAVRDITERMNAQENLRKSEARYRALSEATFEAIFISEKGVCLDTNQRAVELFGYDYDELIGIFGTDVIAAEYRELVKRHMLSGYERPYEAIAQKKDGTKFHVEIRGKMMRYEDKDVRITVIRDIDQQKRATEALHRSEKRYRELFNSIPIGLYRTTPEGSILDVNPAMLDILGYPDRNTLLQENSLDIYIDPNDRKQVQRLLEEKGYVHDFAIRLCRHDGRSTWVSINTTMVHDSDRQMTYYEGAMADISDRKASEERIHKLSQQLMQAQEDERQMISRELHDTVAQDLSVAKMACDLIYGELSSKRLPEADRIQEISGALQKTILGVRNMAYDLRPPGLEELGLVETIYRFCEDFAQMWGLSVDFQSAGLKNLKLEYGIQINIYRLVQEGLANIRKHAAAGRAAVKLIAAFPNIILRVEDNGRGFDVQARAAAADQEKRMGLRSMQERVTLLNGEMKLQSKPGQGTKVFIKLPFAEKKSGTKENHLNR